MRTLVDLRLELVDDCRRRREVQASVCVEMLMGSGDDPIADAKRFARRARLAEEYHGLCMESIRSGGR